VEMNSSASTWRLGFYFGYFYSPLVLFVTYLMIALLAALP
jgi:hypothetical protein